MSNTPRITVQYVGFPNPSGTNNAGSVLPRDATVIDSAWRCTKWRRAKSLNKIFIQYELGLGGTETDSRWNAELDLHSMPSPLHPRIRTPIFTPCLKFSTSRMQIAPISIERYHRMIELGVFDDWNVELLEATLGQNKYVECPHCETSFSTRYASSWDSDRHVSCQGRIRLVESDEPKHASFEMYNLPTDQLILL